MTGLRQQALAWLSKDPDEETQNQLRDILERNDEIALKQAFSQRLSFGTAGLRGLMGVGPNNMNRLVIRETTAGLAEFLHKARFEARQRVVIAYDGRHGSAAFARDAAGVLAARDIDVLLYDTVAPTPLCAFAVRKLGTAAGIVVTASHNPPAYNGYKVYRLGGTQINDPVDGQIADEIAKIASDPSAPECMPEELAKKLGRLQYLGKDMFDAYMETISASIPSFLSPTDGAAVGRSSFRIAYTPMHGVGAIIAEQLLARRGFTSVWTVKEQREPDGNFPTVEFPNPEEPGATDRVMALADKHDAPLAIANDPDADRLCICVRDRDGKMRQMTGDQLGSLLGDMLIRRALEQQDTRPVAVRSTIVSSRTLARVAKDRGAEHMETLTGFKWLGPSAHRAVQAGKRFVFAYEEALGYMVTDEVLDKDGLSALLAITEYAYAASAQGRTLWDELEAIHARVGLSVTMQRTIKLSPGTSGDSIMKRLRSEQRSQVGSFYLAHTDDLLQRPAKIQAGSEEIPKNDVLRYYVATDESKGRSVEQIMLSQPRIIVRPSGTEPKVKIYCEMLGSIKTGETYDVASQRVTNELTEIVDAFHAWMSGDESQTKTAGTSRRPSWIARNVLSYFPLRTYPPAKVISPMPQGRIERPILYVAQPHPNNKFKWASRDPRCLYWQVLLLFRGVDFDVMHVGGYDDPNSALGRLPFLQNANSTIVAMKDLPVWIRHVSPEEKRSTSLSVEMRGTESLLTGPLMAGVLLEMLTIAQPPSSNDRPILSQWLQDSLEHQKRRRLAGYVSTLTDGGPANRMPGWTASFFGLLGGGAMANVGSGEEAQEENLEPGVDLSSLNRTKILADAIEAIQALSALLEASSSTWLEGGSEPSHLDALFFALIHTAWSLPSDVCPELRSAIESTHNLPRWTRQIWQDHVRPRGG